MTIEEQYEHLEKTVRGYNHSVDFSRIRAAFEFAEKSHDGQKRKSGEPYIIHPLAVARVGAGRWSWTRSPLRRPFCTM